jgi:hypothetical protein
MTVTAAAFLFAWATLASLVWLVPLLGGGFYTRAGAWAAELLLVLGVGYALDAHFLDRPHGAWTALEFYLVILSLHLIFAAPGFVYWFAVGRK